MSRNVFISFLGTSDYVECNYYHNEDKVNNVKFVQEALIQIFCKEFNEGDIILMFLTDKAKREKWNGEAGLEKRLKNLELLPQVLAVDIKDGKSEEEIWDIFKTVYDKLEVSDRVFLDITHGFRSLPMLGIVLLNYAKFLKDIQVRGVYYGAYEARSSQSKVTKNMVIEEINTPIFDLTSFNEILNWSAAGDNFVNYGNSDKLTKIIKENVRPILKETKWQDTNANLLRDFATRLDTLTKNILSVRGKNIIKEYDYDKLYNIIIKIKDKLGFTALNPIIDKLEERVKNFENNNVLNGLKAVKWCIDNNLIQQGITLLQETMISYIIDKEKDGIMELNLDYNELYDVDKEIWEIKELRYDVSGAINKKNNSNGDNKEWHFKNDKFVDFIIERESLNKLCKSFMGLKNARNKINHAGMLGSDAQDFNYFKNKLNSIYDNVVSEIK